MNGIVGALNLALNSAEALGMIECIVFPEAERDLLRFVYFQRTKLMRDNEYAFSTSI